MVCVMYIVEFINPSLKVGIKVRKPWIKVNDEILLRNVVLKLCLSVLGNDEVKS